MTTAEANQLKEQLKKHFEERIARVNEIYDVVSVVKEQLENSVLKSVDKRFATRLQEDPRLAKYHVWYNKDEWGKKISLRKNSPTGGFNGEEIYLNITDSNFGAKEKQAFIQECECWLNSSAVEEIKALVLLDELVVEYKQIEDAAEEFRNKWGNHLASDLLPRVKQYLR